MNESNSPFSQIISGNQPGNVIVQDESLRLAIIEAMEPEAAIHWLAVPFEVGYGTEELEKEDQQRFLDLINFAITQTKALTADYPLLANGFTVKFHVGSFETIPHAKLHILSTE